MAKENEEKNNLDDLSKLKVDDKDETILNEPKIDTFGRSYATGRRKESTARVWVKRGTGKISICLLYTSPSPRDSIAARMPSSA